MRTRKKTTGKSKRGPSRPQKKRTSEKNPIRDVHVVKRRGGHLEQFDERKAYASVYWSCRSAHLGEQDAEAIAEMVVSSLKAFLRDRRTIDSSEIFLFIYEQMQSLNYEAAYMYKTHLDLG